MNHKITYALIFVFIVSFAVNSQAIVRECSYEIYIKSDKEGIKSTLLPNGSLISRGRYKGGTLDFHKARRQAAMAAKRCMDTAFDDNKLTKYCKPRKWTSNRDGYVSKYNVPKLKSVAYNTACDAAWKLGKRKNQLGGLKIWAKNVTGGKTKYKPLCNIRDDHHDYYYVIDKGRAVYCSGATSGTEVPAQLVPGQTHFESFSDIVLYKASTHTGKLLEVGVSGNKASFKQVHTHMNWLSLWNIIVPGYFGSISSNSKGDLLFYDSGFGKGELYTVSTTGNIIFKKSFPNWANGWDFIIPGNFNNDGVTDLLFYDSQKGLGWLYTVLDNGDLKLLRKYNNWTKGWEFIIPGNFNNDRLTDLLFYDNHNGLGFFYSIDSSGNIRLMNKHRNWKKGWDIVVPINLNRDGYTDLLFYKKTGMADFYTTDGAGRIIEISSHKNWFKHWDYILPLTLGPTGAQALLFYRKWDGKAEIYKVNSQGDVSRIFNSTWAKNWDAILSYPN